MPDLLERLSRPTPAVWLEVAPPRGINCESLLSKLGRVRGDVDAVNLTDNALGRVKLSALVFAGMIKSRLALPVVLNVSCRDRNLLALKSDLLGAAALGVEAVVAITGDRLEPGVHQGARKVGGVDAVGLLKVIGDLNRGDTGEGKRLLKTLPALVPGAVANPNRPLPEREFELLARKAAAGARFVITQPVFDPDLAHAFAARARRYDLKVILGVLPIKREAMATYLQQRVADLRTARDHLRGYQGLGEEQARELSLRANLELMEELAGEVSRRRAEAGR